MTSATSEGFVLEGERSSLRQIVTDVWRCRSLLVMLARKDFFVKYRRASFGMLWAVGLPAVQALVLAVVFSRFVRFETAIPYGTFVFCGILPWSYFNSSLGSASTSIVDGQNLATKVYFPRAILPLAVLGAGFYGFLPAVGVLIATALLTGVDLGPELLYLAPACVVMVALTAGFALLLSAVHVYFRDVRYVLAAALVAWMYGTPVIYPLTRIGGVLQDIIKANPATGMVELFRASLGAADPGWEGAVAWTIGWTVALWIGAAVLHRRHDRVFVDLL